MTTSDFDTDADDVEAWKQRQVAELEARISVCTAPARQILDAVEALLRVGARGRP